MPEITRDQQRSVLHKTIWGIADHMRNSVDAWDFKQYVLITLFYRYISEDLENWINDWERREGNPNPDYAGMADADAEVAREAIVDARGYFIAPSMLFKNVLARADKDKDLNVTLERVFKAIEDSTVGHESEKDFRGLFDDFDMNSTRLGGGVDGRNRRLVEILRGIDSMELNGVADAKIDLFGDAYEYLMTMYAAGAGKSGGEFFTPQEVSRLLALIATEGKASVNKVYENCTTSLIRIVAA